MVESGMPAISAEGQILDLLRGLRVGLVIASYQGSVVAVVSATPSGLSLLARTFDKPMGLAANGSLLAVAARNELVVLADAPTLAPGYKDAAYDHLWLPRTLRLTGEVDLHDLHFAGESVLGVATRLSCIVRLDDQASVAPVWTPPFITGLAPEDRCHLNGMALDAAGAPRFATALGATDTAEGWRGGRATGGILMSVPDGRILRDDLCMPHSPRLIGGKLYVLNSGAGEVLRVDPQTGASRTIARLPGFARGMADRGGFLFIGLSRLRDRHGAGAAPLPVEAGGTPLTCGVVILHALSGRVMGSLTFAGGIDEVSDIALLPGAGRHGLLNHTDPAHRTALALPGQGFWAVPKDQGQAPPAGLKADGPRHEAARK